MIGVDRSPSIVQCNQHGERKEYPRPTWRDAKCGFCDQPISLKDFLVVVSDYENHIGYPCPDDARAFLSHGDCGPGAGYWIDLAAIAAKGTLVDYSSMSTAEAWRTHLRCKDWFNPSVSVAFERAHALAARLREDAKFFAPAMPTKPYAVTQRPSRVSRNPRAITTRTRTRILERDGFRCRRCGNGPDVAPLVIDHVVPVAKGGTADEANLQTLCRPCNAGKSAREPHPHDFRSEGRA